MFNPHSERRGRVKFHPLQTQEWLKVKTSTFYVHVDGWGPNQQYATVCHGVLGRVM